MARMSKGQLARLAKEKNRNAIAAQRILNSNAFKGTSVLQQKLIVNLIDEETREARRQAEIMGYEKAMIHMSAALCQVMTEDYWKKTANKRLQKLIADIASLMDSGNCGNVTWEEQADYIQKKCGLGFKTDWMGKEEFPTPRKLFIDERSAS